MAAGTQPPDGPPVCTALTERPFVPPSPTSYTKRARGVPSGISTRPIPLTLPTSEKTFVPALFALPIPVNHSAPLVTMGATLYQVSTLLMLVGAPKRPFWAG